MLVHPKMFYTKVLKISNIKLKISKIHFNDYWLRHTDKCQNVSFRFFHPSWRCHAVLCRSRFGLMWTATCKVKAKDHAKVVTGGEPSEDQVNE